MVLEIAWIDHQQYISAGSQSLVIDIYDMTYMIR